MTRQRSHFPTVFHKRALFFPILQTRSYQMKNQLANFYSFMQTFRLTPVTIIKTYKKFNIFKIIYLDQVFIYQ